MKKSMKKVRVGRDTLRTLAETPLAQVRGGGLFEVNVDTITSGSPTNCQEYTAAGC